MRIIPAIDLKDGNCVRLYKGDFDQTTEYSKDPASIARRFSALSVADLHVVDLDGARTGVQSNLDAVRSISEASTLSIQLGGGIRDATTIERWIDAGVSRCVVGSVAAEDPEQVIEWIGRFGADRIVIALDVRLENGLPLVTTHGWTRDSGLELWTLIDRYRPAGLRHVLCTDVSRDGAMAGPNIELYTGILARYPTLELQASGGVRHIDDLRALREAGLPAAISGRALLDGKITAEEIASFPRSA